MVTFARDRIYIFNGNISTNVNSKIKMSHQLFATQDKDCMDLVFRVMCHYYFPPCGNISRSLPPSSICQEECAHVQSQCQKTWQKVEALLRPFPFIKCDDTSQLLFPLQHCCTGAGILTGTRELASSSMVPTTTPIGGTPTPILGKLKQAFQVTHTTAYILFQVRVLRVES